MLRLFGKTKEGESVCVFFKKFFPYFYVLPKKEEELIKFLEKNYKDLIVNIKEVFRFLPLGYQKEKTKLLKVTLKDPSKVPKIREDLKEKKSLIEDIFEADILFKYRFMADFSLSGFGWARAKGNFANTNSVKANKILEAEEIFPEEMEENAPLKILSIDIEVSPSKEGLPDSKKDPIILIGLSFYPAFKGLNTIVLISKRVRKKEKDVFCFENEKEMLEELQKIVDTFDPDIITGYNLNNFDLPYLLDRFSENKLIKNIGRCKDKIANSKTLGAKKRNYIPGRIIVDVYELVKESVGKGLLRLKRYGLGDVSRAFLGEDKVDIKHSEIKKYWNGSEEQIDNLITYTRKDAILALRILLERKMLDKFIELSKVSGLLLQDVLDAGESSRIENLLLREFNKNDFVIPCKPTPKEIAKRNEERIAKGFKGALVLEPETGLHTVPIVYLDFKAMYPSIFIAFNICPTTLFSENNLEYIETPSGARFVSEKVRRGIIPRILSRLIEERDKIKSEMEKAKEEKLRILNAKQHALKIMTNAFYGYTGYVRARLYALEIATGITSCGRQLIQKTKEIVESLGYKVVYGDTDSIMVKTGVNKIERAFEIGNELEREVNKRLEGVVKMKIESIFKSLLILTKKRYAGLSVEKKDGSYEEKIIMKGIETVRRDWCDLVSKTLYTVLEILLKEQNPRKAYDYVKDILEKLEKNEIPIEDLMITKSISKSLKEYKGIQPHVELVKKLRKRSGEAPGIGDRVSFVIVKGPQILSKRAEDPDYVRKNKLQIDSHYYIEGQLLPPLERVFEAIGFSRSELIGMGKQLVLSEAIKNGPKVKQEALKEFEGFICKKCNMIYRRIPLMGRCIECGDEILFFSNGNKSRFLNI
ncbi:MAG: DNA polymerase domain-containing protein [Candidatus Aenigmatarchaeota archaeon]